MTPQCGAILKGWALAFWLFRVITQSSSAFAEISWRGFCFLSTSLLILKTGVGEPYPFFWRSFSSLGAPRHSCEKSVGCFVFCETVCDIFFVNLGKLTSVWKERHLARFLVLSGEVFVFRSYLFQKTIVKINFNEYEKLIESGHSSFMKKITPKFSKCRRCGNVLKSFLLKRTHPN